MNNRGFAISTMLYGLVIIISLVMIGILSTMSFNRKSSREFTSGVIDSLEGATKPNDMFAVGYVYNSSTCVTGEEETCTGTVCYKTKTSGSCPAGTIIKYKVNDTTLVTFHVIRDYGSYMYMQSQTNTVYNVTLSGTGTTSVYSSLYNATSSWSNVNNVTLSTSSGSRTAKARLMTQSEANNLGCSTSEKSCPNWMNNYLYNSTTYNGTENDRKVENGGKANEGYLVYSPYYISYNGSITYGTLSDNNLGARAVVYVNK